MNSLRWHDKLYIGRNASRNKDTLMKQLYAGDIPAGFYLITLSVQQENQLQIFSARNIQPWLERTGPLTVVGIASDYEEAQQLVAEMTQDSLQLFQEPCPRKLFESDCSDDPTGR